VTQRTDTERLDAIERHGWHVIRNGNTRKGCSLFVTDTDWVNAPTLREAIDTAMAMLDAEEGA
jgi:hypothetical protein